MTEQLTQEQLDTETDAMIIQMDRAQRTNYLKFGAMMILLVISVFAIISMTVMIPEAVMSIINGGKDVKTTLPLATPHE